MGYLYRPKLKSGGRSLVWWMKYYVNGRPVRESTGISADTENPPREAERILKDREGRVVTGQPVLPRVDRISYGEVAQDLRDYYKTTGKRDTVEAECRLKHLDAFFTGWRLAGIGATEITKYVRRRQEQGASNGTINRELEVLGKMLRLAYKRSKLLRVPPIEKLKEAGPRQGFFERDEFEAVWRYLPQDLRVAIEVAYTLGWRMQSEVLTLTRAQFDPAGTLRLEPGTTKNGDGRVVSLPEGLKLALIEQVERVKALEGRLGREVPYLFPHLRGRRAGQRLGDFAKRWRTALVKAELEGLEGEAREQRKQELQAILKLPARERRAHPKAGLLGKLRHDLRRTAVRNAVNAGVVERVAMKLTGHRTRAVFDRYHIVSPADLEDAARKIGTATPKVAGTFSGTFKHEGATA